MLKRKFWHTDGLGGDPWFDEYPKHVPRLRQKVWHADGLDGTPWFEQAAPLTTGSRDVVAIMSRLPDTLRRLVYLHVTRSARFIQMAAANKITYFWRSSLMLDRRIRMGTFTGRRYTRSHNNPNNYINRQILTIAEPSHHETNLTLPYMFRRLLVSGGWFE